MISEDRDELAVFIPYCEATGYYLINAIAATRKESFELLKSLTDNIEGVTIKPARIIINKERK